MRRLISVLVCSIVSVMAFPEVTVNPIPGLPDTFIKGADISMLMAASVIACKSSKTTG